MRAVIQRVKRAAVRVQGDLVGSIDAGLLVLLCIEKGDDEVRVKRAAHKLTGLRCFSNESCFGDEAGRMNHDLANVGGAMLVVSQFTLSAELHAKGRRPGFDAAAPADVARPLVQHFIDVVAGLGIPVATGVFGAHMQVALENDGPVTFVYEDR